MVEFPSFSGWMSKQSLLTQMNISIMLKTSPLFIFFWGLGICKSLGYSQETSLVIPAMVATAILVFFLYWDYGNRNASTAYLPINMTVQWDNSNVEEIVTTITHLIPLRWKKPPYVYAAKFNMPQKDDKGEDYQYGIFITKHAEKETFRRIPKQFIAYGGSVFEGMASRIVATYANEYEDIQGFSKEEQQMGQFKVFHVKWCSEDSTTDQKNLGLYEEDPITKEIVELAAQLNIDRIARRLGMQNRELEGKVETFAEAWKDGKTKSYEDMNYIIDDIDRIKQERMGIITRMLRDTKVRIILAILTAAVVLYVLRYYKVI
jgi:hypothetical protein